MSEAGLADVSDKATLGNDGDLQAMNTLSAGSDGNNEGGNVVKTSRNLHKKMVSAEANNNSASSIKTALRCPGQKEER